MTRVKIAIVGLIVTSEMTVLFKMKQQIGINTIMLIPTKMTTEALSSIRYYRFGNLLQIVKEK
jgi:hypothetical protein